MPTKETKPGRASLPLHNAIFGFAFVLLPLFFLYGSHDAWNLPRWVLSAAFLSVAIPVTAFLEKRTLQFPSSLFFIGLFWIVWTALSATSLMNVGDAVYLIGVRAIGLGFALWLMMQRNIDRIIPWLAGLGAIEVLLGIGELTGLVTMNELMEAPIGTVGNNNIYGCFLALLLPFLLMLILRKGYQYSIILMLLALCMGFLIIVSSSKSAILGILIAGGTLGSLHFLKQRTGVLSNLSIQRWVIILIPLLLVLVPILWAPLNFSTGQLPTEGTTGITERGMLWVETIDMCQQDPLLGRGPAGWKYAYLEKGLTGYNALYGLRIMTRPHNDFLWIAAESGIPAALAYISFLTILFFISVRQAWRSKTKDGQIRSYLLAAGVLIWIVISNLNFPIERVDHIIVFAAYLALILFRESAGIKLSIGIKKGIGLFLAIVMIFLTVVGGKRYLNEKHLQQVFIAHQNGQSNLVLQEANQINDDLFTVDYYSSTPVVWYKGIALLQTGKHAEALEQLRLAYEINPWHPHVVNNLASNYVILGDHDQAEVYYKEAISRFQDFPDPYINLSRILTAGGDTTSAIEVLRTFPDEPKSHKQSILKELELIGR